MLHTKTFMFALVTAGILAAPTAQAGMPKPYPPPYPDMHDCEDIELKELDVSLTDHELDVTGVLKGLMNHKPAKVTLKATGEADFKCMNNGGQFPKPHQPAYGVPVKAVAWTKIEADDIYNGKAEFELTAHVSTAPMTCKHPFKAVNEAISIDHLTFIVEQKECKVKISCEIEPALVSGKTAALGEEIECTTTVLES